MAARSTRRHADRLPTRRFGALDTVSHDRKHALLPFPVDCHALPPAAARSIRQLRWYLEATYDDLLLSSKDSV
jgi:hypothetical protein